MAHPSIHLLLSTSAVSTNTQMKMSVREMGFWVSFHLHPSILVEFSNNLYREVMLGGGGEQKGQHSIPSPAGSVLLCFLNKMTLMKDCWHNGSGAESCHLPTGLFLIWTPCFGVKPKDVGAVSCKLPLSFFFLIINTAALESHLWRWSLHAGA